MGRYSSILPLVQREETFLLIRTTVKEAWAWASKRFSTDMANDDEPKSHLFGIKNLSHKTLLQSDALYQVNSATLSFSLSNRNHIFARNQHIYYCSTYLKPVFIQESTSAWRSSARWQKNTLGKIILILYFLIKDMHCLKQTMLVPNSWDKLLQ